MEEWNDFAYSKQQTSREATNSEMDPGYFRNTPLSSEETMEKEHMVSHANNAGSADCSTLQETNKDNTLHSKYAFEDQGPDHENSMSEGQDNLDISCNTPHSTLGEVFENNSKEADIKSAKNKIVDATCPNDNSSKTCQQECNVSTANRAGNRSSVVPYTLMKSEDSATAQIVEDHCALNGDGTTELFGVEQKAKEASRPSASILGHNEVSNMSPTPEDTDGNASTLNPDDDTDTDACTNTAGNKQQDGGKVCEGRTIDSESKRSAGHGEDLTELLHPAPSIKEADVTEKRDTVCNDITHNDNSSTGLHLEDTSVTTIISPDNNSSKILKTEDSSTADNEKTKCSSGSQSLNNMTTKLSGSEHIDDDFCYSHGGNKSLSTANDTGRNASSISNGDGTNIKYSNISACSKLQGGGDLDTMEAENKKSMENRRSNNESSCLEPNTDKSDITTAYEENKISPEVYRPNNSTMEIFGSGHNGNVGNRLMDEINISSTDSPTAKIDSPITTTSNEMKTGANAMDEGRNKDFTQRDTSTASFVSDKKALIDPEDKTSIEHGKRCNKFSCPEPKIRKIDVDYGKSKVCDAISPSSISPSHDIVTSVDHPTQYCSPNIFQPEGSTTLCLTADVPRSQKQRKKACKSKRINKVNYRPNDDKQAYNWVTGATKTDGNASIDDGCNQTANISKTNTGASSDACTGRRRHKQCFKNDATTRNHNPEDRTSSRDGGENSVLSFLNPKRQDQSQTNETNPIVSDTTSSICFQKHGDVSTSRTRANEKSWNGIRGLRNACTICLFLLTLIKVNPVQASPMQLQCQQWFFCNKNNSLKNQSLAIENIKNSGRCTFNYTTTPFFHHCPEIGAYVFAENETHVEMLTTDLTSKDWIMACGIQFNGDDPMATRGELLNGQSVMNKISKYINSPDSSADKNQTKEQSETKDWNKTEHGNKSKDGNNTKDENNMKLIIPLVLLSLAVFGLVVLWFSCPKFRSFVRSRIGLGTNNDPKSVSDSNSNTNPSSTRLTPASGVNEIINENDHKDDESQRLNPESSEEPHPDTSETSL